MTELQKNLYKTFQEKLDAWAQKPRPHSKNWHCDSIIANPEYFEKFSNFRTTEWNEYLEARDNFMISVTSEVH
jgi:hypothetical protein